MRDAVLGIDIGTSAVKAILFDVSGAEVATASRSYGFLTPQPGWVEQDPEVVWEALASSVREMLGRAGDCHVLSLALAAQAGSVIPVQENGDPAYPMVTWLDSRSSGLVNEWMADGTADRIRELSGWHPYPGLPLPSIAWLQRYRPEVCARAARYLGVADFFIYRLSGCLATDYSAAAEMILVDARTGQWNEQLCELGGLDPARQPALGWAGRQVGRVTPEAAALTGLPAGTPVIAGGHDHCCECVAMGITRPGKMMLSTGTAWTVTGAIESPALDGIPEAMNLNYHVVPGRWTVTQLLGGFGATVDWWIEGAWQSPDPGRQYTRKELYPLFDKALLSSVPGSHGVLFLPFTEAPQEPGGLGGGGFVGLELASTRADMSRAVLEGCAFEVRWFLDDLGSRGMREEELWISGGATGSPVWPQILADVTGVPIVLARYPNWAALGAAILAGWGIGVYPSLEEGIERLQPPVQRILPDLSLAELYAGRLALYQRTARKLTGAEHRL
jgi:xylulokinase